MEAMRKQFPRRRCGSKMKIKGITVLQNTNKIRAV